MPREFSYESMGTKWHITIWDKITDELAGELQAEIVRRSEDFDRTYSRFIRSSLVWQLSEQTGVVDVPADFMEMLTWYQKLYEPSDKKLNPLIGFSISDLGYDADYSLIPKEEIRRTPDLFETIRVVDDHRIRIAEPVLFDFGALGKGYFVDKIRAFLKERGLKRFLVDGSGDIAYSEEDGTPIQVGLEHPGDTSKVIGMIPMRTGAMCSSGSNRRAWGPYHHIIDPTSLTSPREIIATWVIADSAVLADGLASCLFFVQPEQLEAFHFEYCILNSDYKVRRSAGFTAELF